MQPLEIRGEQIPPVFGGLPADDTDEWGTFRDEFERTHRPMWETFNNWVVAQGADPLPYLEFMHDTNAANIYVYPEEAD